MHDITKSNEVLQAKGATVSGAMPQRKPHAHPTMRYKLDANHLAAAVSREPAEGVRAVPAMPDSLRTMAREEVIPARAVSALRSTCLFGALVGSFLFRRFQRSFFRLFFRISCFSHIAPDCSDMSERAECPDRRATVRVEMDGGRRFHLELDAS